MGLMLSCLFDAKLEPRLELEKLRNLSSKMGARGHRLPYQRCLYSSLRSFTSCHRLFHLVRQSDNMGFPHQVLPIVAIADMTTAIIASFHLGLLPRSLTLQAHSMLDAITSRLQGTAPAIVSHRIVIEQANPKRLLFWMLVLCIVRCLVILLVWSSVKDGIEAGRVRSQSEDYSGRAVLYSIVCVVRVSIAVS
jgi:hypothetical protein